MMLSAKNLVSVVLVALVFFALTGFVYADERSKNSSDDFEKYENQFYDCVISQATVMNAPSPEIFASGEKAALKCSGIAHTASSMKMDQVLSHEIDRASAAALAYARKRSDIYYGALMSNGANRFAEAVIRMNTERK